MSNLFQRLAMKEIKDLTGATVGQYQIAERLGSGGMAVVYRALQPSLGREVALKVLSPALVHQEGFTQRFENEARTLARLDHPHILPVYDFGIVEGVTFIATPLVRGGTLKNMLTGQALPLAVAWRYLSALGDGLHHAHEVGVIHRDLKPSNVLLHADGRPLLGDFGLARPVEAPSGITVHGFALGTPGYMSPEQAMGAPIDARTDVYSLGVIAFEMLTGTRPYVADNATDLVRATVYQPVPSACSRNSTLPIQVDAVLARALAKDPNQRPTTALQFTHELTVALMAQYIGGQGPGGLPGMPAMVAPQAAQAPAPPPGYPMAPASAPGYQMAAVPPAPMQVPPQSPAYGQPPMAAPPYAPAAYAQPAPEIYHPTPPPPMSPAAPGPHSATQTPYAAGAVPHTAPTGTPPPDLGHPSTPMLAEAMIPTIPSDHGSAPTAPVAGQASSAGPLSTGVSIASALMMLEHMGVRRLRPSTRVMMNSFFSRILRSAYEVAGEEWGAVLTAGDLQEYAYRQPPDNPERGIPVDHLSRLAAAHDQVFGAHSAEKLRALGRLVSERDLDRDGSAKKQQRRIRLIPASKRLAIVLNQFAVRLDDIRGEHLHTTKQIDNNRLWLVLYDNPIASGRTRHDKVCDFWVASLESLLRWAGLANDWMVEEVECGCMTATGDCVFAIRSSESH